jgi:DNA/RNA endonuclease G (NUC1)
MFSSPPDRRSSVRALLLTIFLIGSLIIPLTPLGRFSPAFFMPTAHAASFASSNLIVYRVGDIGPTALSSAATPVYLDEYTPAGTLVQSIAMPLAASGANRRLTASGTAASEGLLTRSVDGKYIILAGYDAAVGTLNVAGTTTTAANRVIGRVDASGNVDTTTALTDSSGNARGAVSTNGTDLWITGSNNGVRYAPVGATTSTQLSTTTTNLRGVNIFDNQLFISAASGTTRVATVGTNTPTTSGQTITNIPGIPTSGSPYAFFFADLSAAVPGADTLYVADDGVGGTAATTGIKKYSLSGGSWVLSGSVTGTAMKGITGTVTGSTATLYATASTGSTLVKYIDGAGYNAAPSGTLSTIATAGNNTAFRGVAMAPVAGQVSTNPSGVGSATPNSIKAGDSTLLSVSVSPGANPASQSYTIRGNLTAIGGSSQQQFFGTGTGPYTFNATIAPNITAGQKTIPITITDDVARSGATSIAINVQPETLDHVVISQVYGGGGNTGDPAATLKNDFIELYNPTANTVSLNGWSVQYASASGSTWTVTDLSGSIAPGQYYLIKESQGTGGSVDLPTPNATGTIFMGAGAGKVALVNNTDSLGGTCPVGSDIVDFVGYGSANCYEGLAPTDATNNATAALRNGNGSVDTDNNGADFTVGNPNPRASAGGGGGGGSELAPFVSSNSPGKNATNVLVDANITVNFSEPVNVTGSWFTISCASGTHAATATGGPTSFTLNPTVNFNNGEQCTVTISASQVKDQDSSDPPDNMLADYFWTFTTVATGGPVRDPNEHLVMGIPSPATQDTANENDYLMKKPEYALSYNKSRALPNWTSWHLDSSWRGGQSRTNTFRADPDLPAGWYQVNEFSFSGSGFDRGHMTPSADRTFNYQENAATFLMTNMVPQAPDNNQVTWEGLESYARTLLTDNEVYIISGGWGQGGTGRNGFAATVDQGRVVVPEKTWKVLLILPIGDNDVSRVNTSTRTIGVIMPNAQGINADWHNFIVSVDEVEALTGYDFFSNVPVEIQAVIEANADGNTRPVANNQAVTVQEDGSKAITLTATDAEGNTLSYAVANGPTHGALSGSGANFTYTPDANFNGQDSFTFTVKDKYLTSAAATVSINVTEVNDAVVVGDDSNITAEDTALSFPAGDLTINDNAGANEGGQTLTVMNVTQTLNTHGTVSLVSGQVTYIPDGNYNGPASFDYQVCDNGTTNGAPDAQCGTGVVNITVVSVNDNPVAVSDAATTDEDTPVTIDVIANDTDSDGGTPALTSVGGAANGSVSIQSGQAVFSPGANYSGTGSFSYTVIDGQGGTATGSVTVTINPVNDAPTANARSASTNEDNAAAIVLTGSDTETPASGLSFAVVSNPAHGVLSGSGANLTYTPNANYNGTDSFTFNVTDTGDGASAALTSSEATVSINITAVNDAPTAGSQSVTTDEDSSKSITLAGSDIETPAGGLSYTVTSVPVHGVLTGTAPNLTYVPEANYYGPDSFQFTVTDTGEGSSGALTSAPATVSITVNPVNDAPVAEAGANQVVECSHVVTLSGSAFDQEGDALTFEWLEGTNSLGTGATLNTTLGAGTHTITLKVTDTSGASGTDTMSVNIIDTTLPTITSNGQTISLWPVNKQYTAVSVANLVAGASDACDTSVTLNSVRITKVTSDEGSASSGDVVIAGDCKSVRLRADRDGNGDGRVYTITFSVRDAAGNTSTLTRQVVVPHDQGSGNYANDSGVAYTVTSSCQ